MKITIDTQVDTHEDIKKVLHILTSILDQKGNTSYSNAASTQTVDTANMMNMFSQDSSPPAAAQKEIPNTPPDFTSFLNLTRNQQKKTVDSEPKVEFF